MLRAQSLTADVEPQRGENLILCETMRAIFIGGERVELGEMVRLSRETAEEALAAGKVRVVDQAWRVTSKSLATWHAVHPGPLVPGAEPDSWMARGMPPG